jgi:hypothetical protein
MNEQARGLLGRIARFAMPEGPVRCRGTWLKQVGEMRFAPDRPWMSFEAEQWFEGDGIDFRWLARVRMAPFLRATVLDSFERSRGALTAHVLGIVPVARASGPATDKAEAMRGLAELPWRPLAFGEGPSLSWRDEGGDKLRATYDDGSTQAAVEFRADEEGRVLGVTASSRPRMVGKSVVDTDWSGVFGEYRVYDQLRVPTHAEVTWQLPEGPFTYWRGRVTDFRVLR